MHRSNDVVTTTVNTEGNQVTEDMRTEATPAVPSTELEGGRDPEVSATEEKSVTAETVVDSEGEEKVEDSEGVDKTSKKSGLHKRIDRLNKRHADETAALKAELEHLRGAQVPTKKEVDTPQGPAKPDAQSFDTHSDYVEALYNWVEAKKTATVEATQREEIDRQEKTFYAEKQQSAQLKLDQSLELGAEKYSDFDEVLAAVKEQPSVEMVHFLIEADSPEEIMYYLSSNEAEYTAILKLTGIAATKALTKLELKLAQTPNGKPASSNAPAPIKPVSASSAVKNGIRDDLDYDEYRKQRLKERSTR